MCSPTPYQYNGIARECAEEGSAIITESKREREQLRLLKEKAIAEKLRLLKEKAIAEKLRQAFANDKTHTKELSKN